MPDLPKIADIVYYYDENKQPHAAIVGYVHPKLHLSGLPVLNLAVITYDARFSLRLQVEPAVHNGTLWKMINRWSWPDEIPDTEWKHLPLPVFRKKTVGLGESLPTT